MPHPERVTMDVMPGPQKGPYGCNSWPRKGSPWMPKLLGERLLWNRIFPSSESAYFLITKQKWFCRMGNIWWTPSEPSDQTELSSVLGQDSRISPNLHPKIDRESQVIRKQPDKSRARNFPQNNWAWVGSHDRIIKQGCVVLSPVDCKIQYYFIY